MYNIKPISIFETYTLLYKENFEIKSFILFNSESIIIVLLKEIKNNKIIKLEFISLSLNIGLSFILWYNFFN